MFSPAFSKAVLEGMLHKGQSEHAIEQIAGMTGAQVSGVLAGKRALSEKQVRRIEDEMEITAGELAASTTSSRSLKRLMAQWASVKNESTGQKLKQA